MEEVGLAIDAQRERYGRGARLYRTCRATVWKT